MTKTLPSITLLANGNLNSNFTDKNYIKALAEDLDNTLKAFKVQVHILDYVASPVSVTFLVKLGMGVSLKTLRNLRVELEVSMASPIEITEDTGMEETVGIIVKKWNRTPTVYIKTILESDEFKNSKYELPIAAGMDILGKPFVFDLASAPHLLIAGTTGSGKSVFIDDIIMSILYKKTAEEVKLIMVDPKVVELSLYNDIPHLMLPVATNSNRANYIFNWLLTEIDERYKNFSQYNVRGFEEYNKKAENKYPRIVVIIDEFMELMIQDPKQTEKYVREIASKGRAAGINLIMATQRPTGDVISREIKNNLSCRASFTVVDWRESKAIIDRTGAERLLGSGDMIFSFGEKDIPVHAQAAYVSDAEVETVIRYVGGGKKAVADTIAMKKITDEMLAHYGK